MNSNHEILEQILRLDVEAGLATAAQRSAQRQLGELARKTSANEELIAKTRTEMSFNEGEIRRQYRKIDELEQRKSERSAKLFGAKTDDEHRSIKHEVDIIEREHRDISRRIEDLEAKIEHYKNILLKAETDLKSSLEATADERAKAEEAAAQSAGKVAELETVRGQYILRLDDRMQTIYRRVAKVTKNPNGPIARVSGKACTNCHMGISPQLLNLINSLKEIQICPICNHILLPEAPC